MQRKCEICQIEESLDIRLVRDHDHGTGFIRGLLCDKCNGRLSAFEKGRMKSHTWAEKYSQQIMLYLTKPSSGKKYLRNARDSVTGFTLGQLKQQAHSKKSSNHAQAVQRLAELSSRNLGNFMALLESNQEKHIAQVSGTSITDGGV